MNKKLILILAMLMATTFAKGQSYSALENYSFGWYIQYMENLVELQDGNILTSTRLFNVDATGHYTDDYGYCFLKLNREDATIMDSVFLPDDYINYHLLEPNPTGDGYLFINQVYDSVTGSNFMKIRHFQDDLVFNDEVVVPLIDTLNGGADLFLMEEESFIMVSHDGHGSRTIQRFSLDGTLMDRAVYPESDFGLISLGIRVWSESPKEYVLWCYTPSSPQSFYYSILDSQLNLMETIALEHSAQYPNVYFWHHENAIESIDDITYLLATPYQKNFLNGNTQCGVQVTIRDKATHTNQKTVYFPLINQTNSNSPYVIGVRQAEDGNIILAYADLSGDNQLSVVMLDANLSVLWHEYYLNLGEWDYARCMKLLKNEGIGIVGSRSSAPRAFVLFVNNDYDSLDEQGITVRPYTYWPNPVHDELHLHYSPDVQPERIELYDLQGRLLQTQTQGLESIRLEGLAAGQYLMKVTLKDGKTFTDKVVKE